MYYPSTASSASSGGNSCGGSGGRPRAHSTGSPLPTPKRTTVKIVMGGKSYTKPRAFEEVKSKQPQQQQQQQPPASSTSRYKTELCRPYQEYKVCKYGDKCQFAHGVGDLRVMPRHPKYKTELCRTYHSTGLCPYGPRCHFIHNLEEARQTDSGGAAFTSTPPPSPTKKTATSTFCSLPISPSVDSGISSPDGYPGACRSFEFPTVASSSSYLQSSTGSSGAGSSGSDEGEDQLGGTLPPLSRSRYSAYSPLSNDYTDLEASESGILSDFTYSDPFVETETISYSSGCSPVKPIGSNGSGGFNVLSDPALDLQNLLMGLGIKDTPTFPPSSPRISPPVSSNTGIFSTTGATASAAAHSSSLNSAGGGGGGGSLRSRLPVFDNILSSQSDTALLVSCASDPGRGARIASSYPTFP